MKLSMIGGFETGFIRPGSGETARAADSICCRNEASDVAVSSCCCSEYSYSAVEDCFVSENSARAVWLAADAPVFWEPQSMGTRRFPALSQWNFLMFPAEPQVQCYFLHS